MHNRNQGTPDKAKNFSKTLKELVAYLGKYKIRMILVIALAIISTIFLIVTPKILGHITTEIFKGLMRKVSNTGGINFTYINKTALLLIVLYVISATSSAIQGFIMADVSNDISYKLRDSISKKINKLPMKYFDNKTHGEVQSIVTNDVDTLTQAINQSITTIITGIVTIIGITVMMLSINLIMTLVVLLVVPLCAVILNFVIKSSQKYFTKQQDYLGHINGHIEEVYGGHDIVSSFNGEEKAISKFNEINNTLYDSAWKSQFYSTAMHPVMQFIGNISYVVISILGGYMVIKDQIEVGDILSFTQYVRTFTQQIAQLAQVLSNVQSAIAAAERVFDFLKLDEETEITSPDKLNDFKKSIEFRDVHFGYNPEHIIIKDFSCKIKEGQKIAIVGPTGAGKTTIVKLLMRFYDLNSGAILIDGKDISKYNKSEVRALFGMVLQDTWLFNGTIEDNIRYGKLDANLDDVREACKMASVDHFIRTLPDGYNLVLNEEADNISGGQKQLLTIARVILKDPKILILDEATSSVDTRTEILIQEAMDKLMEGRTSFIIAHRLSTIRNADLILVMNNGDIVEQGSHDELLKKKGFYAKLYNSQFNEGEEI
jgi:ATP-binding cassette, subfamily B, multidrug efflux pump